MLGRLLSTAFTQTLIPQWLRMEDRVSMANSVESRLPFMDYRLVEFGLGLPSGLKLRDGYTKYILRKAVADLLPREISMQKHKQRYATPYARWMRGPWRPMVEELLLTESPRVESILEMPRFKRRLREFLAGSDGSLDLGMLWRVLHTEIWMRTLAN
jgi:asparagine synthase (glutamine-hydrolysing)